MRLVLIFLLFFTFACSEALNPKVTAVATAIKQLFVKEQPLASTIASTIARIGVIPIIGEMGSVVNCVTKLFDLYEDQDIDAILIYIFSGGGCGGDTLHAIIKEIRLKKPVVVVVETQCLSAAYWAASAAHYIVAPCGAEIGSIGTCLEITRDEHIKVRGDGYEADRRIEIIKSSGYKALRYQHSAALTEENRATLQKEVNDSYDVFCKEVATARNLVLEDRDIWANAKVFTGTRALELKLIDETGSLFEAIGAIKKLLATMSTKIFTDIELIS